MPILLGLADEFVRRIPAGGLGALPEAVPADGPRPAARRRPAGDADGRPRPADGASPTTRWDPTPGVDYDLDGHPVVADAEDPGTTTRCPTPATTRPPGSTIDVSLGPVASPACSAATSPSWGPARPGARPPSPWPGPGGGSWWSTRRAFPRDKFCGDGLTAGALRLLEELGLDPAAVASWRAVRRGADPLAPGPGASPTRCPPGRRAATRRWPAGRDLDAALVDLAPRRRGRGASRAPRWSAARPAGRPGACSSIATGRRRTGASSSRRDYVIGADGMWSPLRKAAGRRPRRLPGRVARLPPVLARRVTGPAADELWVLFEPDLLPGYFWSFPVGDGDGQRRLRHPPRRRVDHPRHEARCGPSCWPGPTSAALLGSRRRARGARTGPGPSRPRSTTSCWPTGGCCSSGDAAGRHRSDDRRGHRPGPGHRAPGRPRPSLEPRAATHPSVGRGPLRGDRARASWPSTTASPPRSAGCWPRRRPPELASAPPALTPGPGATSPAGCSRTTPGPSWPPRAAGTGGMLTGPGAYRDR